MTHIRHTLVNIFLEDTNSHFLFEVVYFSCIIDLRIFNVIVIGEISNEFSRNRDIR